MLRVLIALLLGLSGAQAQIVGTLPYQLLNGQNADASQVMADYNYIISQVNANAAKAGPNSNITSLSGLVIPLSPGQGGSQFYSAGTASGSANAVVVASAITPSGFALIPGRFVRYTVAATNTSSATLSFNGTTATAINKAYAGGLTALTGGEMVAGSTVDLYYNGTVYVLINGYASTVSYTAGTSTGSANAQVVSATTPTGFTLDTRVRVTFTAGYTNTGTLQVNVNGTGLVDVYKQYPSAQVALSGGEITAGSVVDLYYDGTRYVVSSIAPVAASLPGAARFTGVNNTGTPTGKYDLAATQVMVTNSYGSGMYFGSPAGCTVNFSVTNIHNGLDTGSVATSTWYYIYYGSDGINLDCFASASATAPTVPTGYYFARVGAIKTDGSAQLTGVAQRGDMAVYTTRPSITPGAGAQNISLFFPDTALSYKLLAVSSGTTFSISDGLSAVCGVNNTTGISISTQVECPRTGSTFVASGTATFYAYGWRDNAAVH